MENGFENKIFSLYLTLSLLREYLNARRVITASSVDIEKLIYFAYLYSIYRIQILLFLYLITI